VALFSLRRCYLTISKNLLIKFNKFKFTSKGVRQIFSRARYDLVRFRTAAGVWMREYHCRPWSLLSSRLRNAVIRRATSYFSALFGCQYVVKAVSQPDS
ncbi:MAG: hypothetical protein DMG97_29900, partial [Acidobacteria bacterium]